MSNSPTISDLLFRKRSQIDEVPFVLKGDERHRYLAARNATGLAMPSALLVRALVAALTGKIQHGLSNAWNEVLVNVESTSRPGMMVLCSLQQNTFYIPHGEPNKATYHLGVLALVEALARPTKAADFLLAYRELLNGYQQQGLTLAIKPALLKAADELYYFLRYTDQPVSDTHDRLASTTIANADTLPSTSNFSMTVNIAALTDPAELDDVMKVIPVTVKPKVATPARSRKPDPALNGLPVKGQLSASEVFRQKVSAAITAAIDPIAQQVEDILHSGLTPFLVGPTDVGKTTSVRRVATRNGWGFEEISGLSSFADADIVGLRVNGEERPGVIARAFARARFGEVVLLFLDELTRFNKRALDILMRPLLPIEAEVARRMHIETEVSVRVVEVPLWGIDHAPYDQVQVVMAANPWGQSIDPALARRIKPVLVDFEPAVADLFDAPLKDVVKETWKAVAEGKSALPIGYQSLSLATGPSDVTIVQDYLARLMIVDKAAALGFQKIAQGLGLKV